MACPTDTGLQHLGFRTVMTQQQWDKVRKQSGGATDAKSDAAQPPSTSNP
jgi:hypothetical protein